MERGTFISKKKPGTEKKKRELPTGVERGCSLTKIKGETSTKKKGRRRIAVPAKKTGRIPCP